VPSLSPKPGKTPRRRQGSMSRVRIAYGTIPAVPAASSRCFIRSRWNSTVFGLIPIRSPISLAVITCGCRDSSGLRDGGANEPRSPLSLLAKLVSNGRNANPRLTGRKPRLCAKLRPMVSALQIAHLRYQHALQTGAAEGAPRGDAIVAIRQQGREYAEAVTRYSNAAMAWLAFIVTTK
jgi:hypothetical protein